MRTLFLLLLVDPAFGQGTAGIQGVQVGDSDWCAQLENAFDTANFTRGNQFGWSSRFQKWRCAAVRTPQALGLSGEGCWAALTHSGWFRMGAINGVMNVMLLSHDSPSVLPVSTGTVGGGSIHQARYLALLNFAGTAKWSFPCYMLAAPSKEVCYFHSSYGRLSSTCEDEFAQVTNAATVAVYGGIIGRYGGPTGVAAVYAWVHFRFISNLPIASDENTYSVFCAYYCWWNPEFNGPANWNVGHTLVSPTEATQGALPFDYGFGSWMSKGWPAFGLEGASGRWTTDNGYQSNYSISAIVSTANNKYSGNEMALLVAPSAAGPNVFSLMQSYIAVRGLIGAHVVSSNPRHNNCNPSCPDFDGGFSDASGVALLLSEASQGPPMSRPRVLIVLGPDGVLTSMAYLMGQGPMSATQMTPGFPAAANWLPAQAGAYNPAMQAVSAFCGDPLTYDHFRFDCHGDSMCSMLLSVVPGVLNEIAWSVDEYVVVALVAFFGNTPVAENFVNSFTPSSILALPYFNDMAKWFPDGGQSNPTASGLGFAKIIGHSLLDYTTYMGTRCVGKLLEGKAQGAQLHLGQSMACKYTAYNAISALNYSPSGGR